VIHAPDSDPLDPPVQLEPGKRYAAFISYSYSCEADRARVEKLQVALQRMAKHWLQRRALEIFRDRTGLDATSRLWDKIARGLDASDWLVLMASPESAASPWVDREVRRWLATKSLGRIIIVAIGKDELTWDRQVGDFVNDPPVLPPALRGAFEEHPYVVHMEWTRHREPAELTLDDPEFRDKVAEVAAALHGKPKDEIEAEDIRQQKRMIRIRNVAIMALSTLLVLAVVAAGIALIQRERAQTQAEIATSRRLADLSRTVVGTDGALQYLLAAEAWRMADTAEARGALLEAAATDRQSNTGGEAAGVSRLLGHSNGIVAAEFSPAGDLVATIDGQGALRVFPATGAADPVLVEPADTVAVDFSGSADNSLVAAGPWGLRWYDVNGKETLTQSKWDDVTAVAAGEGLFVGRADGSVVRVDSNDLGREVVASGRLGAPVDTLATSGRTLLAGASSGEVLLLDQPTLSVQAELRTQGRPRDVSSDGQRVLATRGFSEMDAEPVVADVYDTGGQVIASAQLPELYIVQDVAFLSDEDVVVVTTGGVDGAPGLAYRLTPSPQAGGTWIDSYSTPDTARVVAVSAGSGRIFVGGDEPIGLVDSFDTQEAVAGQAQGRPVLPEGIVPALPLSGSDSLLVIAGDAGVGVFDEQKGEPRYLAPDADNGVLSPRGDVLITDNGDVIDVGSGEPVRPRLGPVGLDPAPAFSADGSTIAYVPADRLGEDRHQVVVAGLTTERSVQGEVAGRVDHLALNTAGTVLALRGEPGVGPHATPDQPPIAAAAATPLTVVDVSSDWRQIADRTMVGPGPVRLTADDRILVHDGQGVWNLDSATLSGDTQPYVADTFDQWFFSQDGSQVAVVRQCGVDILDPTSWTTVASLADISRVVEGGCAADPGVLWRAGSTLVTAGQTVDFEATTTAWDTDPEILVTRVCRLAGRNLTHTEYTQFVPGFDYRATCPEYGEPAPVPTRTTTGTSGAPSDTTTAAIPPLTQPAPIGKWVAQLFSVAEGEGIAAAEKRQSDLTRQLNTPVDIVRSSDFSSLRPGFWVGYHSAPFTSKEQVEQWCTQKNLSPDACLVRKLDP